MKKYRVNDDYFTQVTPRSVYWAGFIAADGCLLPRSNSVRIKLASKDHQHLETMANDVGFSGPIHKYPGYSSLDIHAVPEWHKYLGRYYNITAQKSLTLKPPVLGSNQIALSFLSGLIDGDGCICCPPSRYKSPVAPRIYLCGTEGVMNWAASWWNYLYQPKRGWKPSGVHAQTPNCFVTSLGGWRVYEFAKYVNTLDLPLLKRKWDRLDLNELSEVYG